MNSTDLLIALALPDGTRVDQRVPKKLLLETVAPTAADKRIISDGVEELRWFAALKPTTVGVPLYRDDIREYLEIAVLSAMFRVGAKVARLTELIHRAVPYPAVLVTEQEQELTLSLAHKRWSQGQIGQTVIDGDVVTVGIAATDSSEFLKAFGLNLALTHQPREHLFALYHGWIGTAVALLAARVTGAYVSAGMPGEVAARQDALGEYTRLDAEIIRLRAAAAKATQMAQRVVLNLELKRVEAAQAAALAKLSSTRTS